MKQEKKRNFHAVHNSKFIVKPIILLGVLMMSMMPICSCTADRTNSKATQIKQSAKNIKRKTSQNASKKKSTVINPKNVIMVNGKKVYFTFKKHGVYYNYLDSNNNIVRTKCWDWDCSDSEVLDMRCYNGFVYAIVNTDLESPRVKTLALLQLIPERNYVEKVAEGNEMSFDDTKHQVNIKTITGLDGDCEADGYTFDKTTYKMQ